MNKPLLPAIDASGRLREAAFALLLRDRRPVRPDYLARSTGVEAHAGRGRLLDLAEDARRGCAEWAGCAEARRTLA